MAEADQVDRTVSLIRETLGRKLVGIYLFGSAVTGGLRPRSDLDLMILSRARLTVEEKRRLIQKMLTISSHPRSVELTIVVEDEIRPWRYPPRMDFQFGNWWRREYELGAVEPYESNLNPDLAALLRLVLHADTPLIGPPPAEVFDPVPRRDYVAGLVSSIDDWLDDLNETDLGIRNVVLALARIWCGVSTDEIRPKDQAADWALPRLPPGHRAVLKRARARYLGQPIEQWQSLMPDVKAYSEYVIGEIKSAAENARTSS